MLTHEVVKELFDYVDGDLYWKVNRGPARTKGKRAGYSRPDGYSTIRIFNRLYRKGRLVYLMFNGGDFEEVDHIDGDPTNDRIENLRPATSSQNKFNTKRRIDNTSGVKGLSWDRIHETWNVRINKDGKTVYCRYFKIRDDAISALTFHRTLLHEEYANHGKS